MAEIWCKTTWLEGMYIRVKKSIMYEPYISPRIDKKQNKQYPFGSFEIESLVTLKLFYELL